VTDFNYDSQPLSQRDLIEDLYQIIFKKKSITEIPQEEIIERQNDLGSYLDANIEEFRNHVKK